MSERGIFRPVPLSEWLALVQAQSPPTFIIPGFVPHDSLVFLSGQPKQAHKSFFAMLLALVAATGKSYGVLRCPVPVNVLYVYREGSAKKTAERFRAIAQGHGLGDAANISNLFIHHRGQFLLDRKEYVDETCRIIKERNIKIIVIDTLAKSCAINENDVKEAGRINTAFEMFREAGATPICVHHLRKGNAKLTGTTSGHFDPDEDMRGSSALAGGYEVHLAVRQAFDINSNKIEKFLLVNSKENEPEAYEYDWCNFDNRNDSDGESFLASCTVTLQKLTEIPYIVGSKSRGKGAKDAE